MVVFETKIKELCRVNGITQKQLYADIGMTDAGMRKMYARNSCEVCLLEKIAQYFKTPIISFFEEGAEMERSTPSQCDASLREENQLLREEIIALHLELAQLRKQSAQKVAG